MGWVLRGKWLIGHVVVVLIAALFIRLGIWQLDRLHQRREHNRVVESRMRAAAVSTTDVPADPDAARYRRVRASGTYDASDQRIVRFRSNEGAPGSWVVTPLIDGTGHGIAVIRGWVPEGAPASVLAPPSGDVTVTGLVDRPTLARPDALAVADIQKQLRARLFGSFVQLQSQTPAPRDGLPDPVPPPELGNGPHLSYALQWFGFTIIGLVGWPLLIRREAQRRRRFSSPR